MPNTTTTIRTLVEGITSGSRTIASGVDEFVANAKSRNGETFAYLEIFDDINKQIENVAHNMSLKKTLPLAGVPIAVKDNILIKGEIASCASRILENYRATYDATVIKKLRDAGAIFIGRTNMDEFAMGSSTENSAFGVTRNPHDMSRVPGGSSGGSAASVASGGSLVALGSDTGGSIRQPSSFCGVVGLKPTYGAVSRFGLVAMASSLDQIGPISNTIDDARAIFNVIKGYDQNDSTSVKYPNIKTNFKKKIMYPKSFLEQGVDPDIYENFKTTIKKLEGNGYSVYEGEIPHIEQSLAIYYIVLFAEASSNLARFDGVRYGLSVDSDDNIERFFKTRGDGFGSEVKRRILLGTYVLSAGYYDAYYKKATDVRALLSKSFNDIFNTYDAVLMPTSPTPAFKIGEKINDTLAMYLADIFTVPANLVGVPALSIPSGKVVREGAPLPVGVQLIGQKFSEDKLFEIGKSLEEV